MARKIYIDPGHGGSDPGAVEEGRMEKDDVLQLALKVGELLETAGLDVEYTRVTDIYEMPYKKAQDANEANADFFVSIHRNSSEVPAQYNGVETLVFADYGIQGEMARNINAQLEQVGFRNIGVKERPNLVVLKRTKMPSVLVEVSFINNPKDNEIFDNNIDEIARGIADGILMTLYEEGYE